MVADSQFVAGLQPTLDDSDTVDSNAVGAIEVSDDEIIIDLSNAAMPPGDFPRIDLNIAFGMAAEQQDRLVHQDVWTIIQGDELGWHVGHLYVVAASNAR